MVIYPLGDNAVVAELGKEINEALNRKVIAMRNWMQNHSFNGLLDMVTGYASLTLLYNPTLIKKTYQPRAPVSAWVRQQLEECYLKASVTEEERQPVIDIPVCYHETLAPDLLQVSERLGLPVNEIIRLHTAQIYRVYMIGFLPGFPYLGAVDSRLSVPRKDNPQNVAAGSVAITGLQTGIYPFNSPGGWHVIGRTPSNMFNSERLRPSLLHAGDQVRFVPIEKDHYVHLHH